MFVVPHQQVLRVLTEFTRDCCVCPAHQAEDVQLCRAAGFSGALIYRVPWMGRQLCLKAWPHGFAPERLSWIHTLMRSARQAGVIQVPVVRVGFSGQFEISEHGRLWDLTEWMAGEANFHEQPTAERLQAACETLAQVHRSWERLETNWAPGPAVVRRLRRCQGWQKLLRSGWEPVYPFNSLGALSRRALELVTQWMPIVPELLDNWEYVSLPLQACLCDVWHDHLLFDGDCLTGLIDYGEAKIDHVAVDLARMLGSLIGDDDELWGQGLRAYRTVRPLTNQEEALARVLDRTGVILGASNWLRWLYHDGRHFDNLDAVARRLTELVQRMERWRGGLLS